MTVNPRWLQRVRYRMHRGLRSPGLRPFRRRIHRWNPAPPQRSRAYPLAVAALVLGWLALLQPHPESLLLFSLQTAVGILGLSRMARGRDRMAYLWLWATRLHGALASLYQQQRAVLAQLLPADPLPPDKVAPLRATWGRLLHFRNQTRRETVLLVLLFTACDLYCLPGQLYSTLLLLLIPLLMLKQLLLICDKHLRQFCFQGWDRSDAYAGQGLFLPSLRLWSGLQLHQWGYVRLIHRAALLGWVLVLALCWQQPLALVGLTLALVMLVLSADTWMQYEVQLWSLEQLERNIPGSDLCSGPPLAPTPAPRHLFRTRLKRA